MRLAMILGGLALAVFGLLCSNYTTDGKADHHRERAQELGLPPPSNAIFLAGLASTALGAGLAGYALGRRRAPPGR
jgi:hypothetical protein